MGNEELNYGDKIALKNWENFSQKKDREFNVIVKILLLSSLGNRCTRTFATWMTKSGSWLV